MVYKNLESIFEGIVWFFTHVGIKMRRQGSRWHARVRAVSQAFALPVGGGRRQYQKFTGAPIAGFPYMKNNVAYADGMGNAWLRIYVQCFQRNACCWRLFAGSHLHIWKALYGMGLGTIIMWMGRKYRFPSIS